MNAYHVALRKEINMITVRFWKVISSAPFSRDGMDEDTVSIGEEEIEFEITFEQAAEYFAPKEYGKWSKEKQDGFIEGIKETYYMDLLDPVIEDEDFRVWAYDNFYEED